MLPLKRAILFHSGNRKMRHFLFSSPPPNAPVMSGHNRSVNRLRRANEKCMTEQSLRRLQEGLLCFYPTSSNIHRAVSPLIRGDSLIALNDEPRQVAKHPVRRSDAAASASNFRRQKAE